MITHHFISTDLAWCDTCRIAYLASSLLKGEPEAVLQLSEPSSLPRGIAYCRQGNTETVSTRSPSLLGIPLVLLTLFWLFLTVYSFTIHVGIALGMALVSLGLVLVTAMVLFCRISLAFNADTGEIAYTRGLCHWLARRRRFNGKDVSEVYEDELLVTEGRLPRPVVILKDGKSFALDFSKNDEKREILELLLCVFIARS